MYYTLLLPVLFSIVTCIVLLPVYHCIQVAILYNAGDVTFRLPCHIAVSLCQPNIELLSYYFCCLCTNCQHHCYYYYHCYYLLLSLYYTGIDCYWTRFVLQLVLQHILQLALKRVPHTTCTTCAATSQQHHSKMCSTTSQQHVLQQYKCYTTQCPVPVGF